PLPVIASSIAEVYPLALPVALPIYSSNPGLVPDGNIVFGGSGADRTFTLTPAANQSGTAWITIMVADPEGASASSSFVLTVNPVNRQRTISSFAHQWTN